MAILDSAAEMTERRSKEKELIKSSLLPGRAAMRSSSSTITWVWASPLCLAEQIDVHVVVIAVIPPDPKDTFNCLINQIAEPDHDDGSLQIFHFHSWPIDCRHFGAPCVWM